MFRIIRLPILLAIAFVVGVFYERGAHADRCADAGGQVRDQLCDGGTR